MFVKKNAFLKLHLIYNCLKFKVRAKKMYEVFK